MTIVQTIKMLTITFLVGATCLVAQRFADQAAFRMTAVELGCGYYDSRSGSFSYVAAIPPVDDIQLLPDQVENHPLPTRKPKAK